MQIVEKKITELKAYEKNPRKNEKAVAPVAESIKEFGFKVPIIIDKDNVIVAGHTRLRAAKKLGMKTVPCIVADDLTPEQIKAFRVADNSSAQIASWDLELLKDELMDLDFDMGEFGLSEQLAEIEKLIDENKKYENNKYTLKDLYLLPPFSIIDGRKGEYLDRKKQWTDIGIKSETGRSGNLINSSAVRDYVSGTNSHMAPSTSIFDPVICELMYAWFNIKNGVILDCFSGGSVRGVVAHKMGYVYYGNDLRQEQIDANIENAKKIIPDNMPNWYCGDSCDIKNIVPNIKYDMIFSCPPYADLEIYSDNEKDISNMNYNDFLVSYRKIIKNSCDLLANDRFAVFVVGDVRDKNGAYYDFISDTKKAFIDSGLMLYNEIIKIDPNGTAGLRANRTFGSYRKVIKTHQNILVFYKGDIKNIKNNFSKIDFDYEI